MSFSLKTLLKAHRAKRRAKLAEWRAGWSHDLNAPGARNAARYDMNWLDHGIIRKVWKNRREVAPGIWRANQPAPDDIARYAKEGIRTILNFRGANQWGSYLLEAEAAATHGIRLVNSRLYSNRAPERDEIHQALAQIETAEKPLLIHCKSGADRAGLASALWVLASGATAEEAASHLSLRHAHVKTSRTGILDAFIAQYAKAHQDTGIGFMDWVDQVYDPETLSHEFANSRAGNRFLDWVLARE